MIVNALERILQLHEMITKLFDEAVLVKDVAGDTPLDSGRLIRG